MEYIQISGKTRQEAIERAIEQLGVDESKMDIQVVDEGSKGFLGIGAKDYIIKVKKILDREDLIREFLEKIFKSMDTVCDINIVQTEENTRVEIKGEDAAIFIGKRGESLDSLQMLTNIVVSKALDSHEKIILDIENYREKREKSLIAYAKKMAKKVIFQRRNIKLEPMNPYERRVIHYALQDDGRINTFSEGEEPNRRIVLSLKKGAFNHNRGRYSNRYENADEE
ncbi:MAG: RNA-binding cell elongation regulator Jag/EloR [Peptoanaerobacter stomatis]|uniref:RNA-binding cell elongation regulator Jag/EloR n=1 Tax=Peptoanaerobacter stomatis TaxID=796937 RepID=UPI003FA01660